MSIIIVMSDPIMKNLRKKMATLFIQNRLNPQMDSNTALLGGWSQSIPIYVSPPDTLKATIYNMATLFMAHRTHTSNDIK